MMTAAGESGQARCAALDDENSYEIDFIPEFPLARLDEGTTNPHVISDHAPVMRDFLVVAGRR